MSDDTDAPLRRVFAESAETLDSAAFTVEVNARIGREKRLRRFGLVAAAVAAGLGAMAAAPLVSDTMHTISVGSMALANFGAGAVGPLGWLLAAGASVYAVVWVRP